MKAVRFYPNGGRNALRLEDAPIPEPGPGEVLIRVVGAGVNFSDVTVADGERSGARSGMTMGREASGTIEAMGLEVEGLRLHQEVMARDVKGAWAEYAVAETAQVFSVPAVVPLPEAGGIPMVYLTAYHLLTTRARVREGETVLVHAAASGVGTAAVQLAKAFGATVIATASTAEKLELARVLGADITINYATDDFEEAVLRVTDGAGVDVVLDGVGGEVTEKSLRSLVRFSGRLVFYGHSSRTVAQVPTTALHPGSHMLLGFSMGQAPGELHKPAMEAMLPLFENGSLRPVVERVIPLADAAGAVDHLRKRGAMGKTILAP